MTRKRRGCRHENARTGMWRAGAQSWLDNTCLIADRSVCQDCGHWLPLGPSNDTGCEVEIRATALATTRAEVGELHMLGVMTFDEEHGWRDFVDADKGGDCPCSTSATRHPINNWHAGYLARCIVEHSATEREAR